MRVAVNAGRADNPGKKSLQKALGRAAAVLGRLSTRNSVQSCRPDLTHPRIGGSSVRRNRAPTAGIERPYSSITNDQTLSARSKLLHSPLAEAFAATRDSRYAPGITPEKLPSCHFKLARATPMGGVFLFNKKYCTGSPCDSATGGFDPGSPAVFQRPGLWETQLQAGLSGTAPAENAKILALRCRQARNAGILPEALPCLFGPEIETGREKGDTVLRSQIIAASLTIYVYGCSAPLKPRQWDGSFHPKEAAQG